MVINHGTPSGAENDEDEELLFRKEAITEQGNNLIGDVVILWRPSLKTIVTLYSFMAVMSILLLLFGTYQRKERAAGILMPKEGLLGVASEVSGSIVELLVKEGDLVEEGQSLLAISQESFLRNNGRRLKGQYDELQGLVAEIMTQRSQMERKNGLEKEELMNQLQDHLQSRDQVEKILLSKMQQKAETDKTFEAAKRLYQQKILSRSEYESRLAIATSLDQAIAEETRRKTSLTYAIKEKKLQLEKLKETLASHLSKLNGEEAEIKIRQVDINSQQKMLVKAYRPGYVSGLVVQLGENVQAGQSLMTLVPRDFELEVQLFVSTHTAPFIRKGQDIWLQMEAFPPAKYGTFPAKVLGMSRAPVYPNEIKHLALDGPRFLVRAELVNGAENLFRGENHSTALHLEADIVLEQRRLIEWILDPLLRARGVHGLD